MRHLLSLLGVAAALASASCSSSGSAASDPATAAPDELTATFTITSTASSTAVRTTFKNAKGYVDVSDPDKVTCNGTALAKTHSGTAIVYTGSVTTAADGQGYEFDLVRGGVESKATVDAPKAFDITAPTGLATVQFNQPLTVTWAPSGTADKVNVTVESTCIDRVDLRDLPDDGTETIDGAKLNGGALGSCDGTVTVTRFHTGAGPAAPFKSSTVTASYAAQTAVTFSP